MSERKRVLLLGATGLIGRNIIARASQMPDLAIVGLARSEMQFAPGTKFEMVLSPSEGWAEAIAMVAPDLVINALGTTRRKAGSMAAFRQVDHDLVLQVAKAAKAAGAQQFVHVSSIGADPHARFRYLRIKGEVEQGLKALKFRRLDILRPSLLRGARDDDPRPLEKLGMLASPLTDLLLRGRMARYRSIHAGDIAAAALLLSAQKVAGTFVHEHAALRRLAARLPSL